MPDAAEPVTDVLLRGGEMARRKAAVILLGPPGSGKTTVADALSASGEYASVKTGHLLRKEAETGSSLGRQLRLFLEAGVEERLEIYRRETIPVVEFFKSKHPHLTHELAVEPGVDRAITLLRAQVLRKSPDQTASGGLSHGSSLLGNLRRLQPGRRPSGD